MLLCLLCVTQIKPQHRAAARLLSPGCPFAAWLLHEVQWTLLCIAGQLPPSFYADA